MSLHSEPPRIGGVTAWGFVVRFGLVAMCGDIVYEGARSITGPLLAHLGASALLVGVVTGVGETAAFGLRLFSGPLSDRSRRFWAWTLGGYGLTVVSVPLLGLATALWLACALVILERVGKAVRSPAKGALLAHATAVTGRGRGFAVHEALDQFGALLGPLIVAGMLALTSDDYRPALLVLAVPGALLATLVVRLAMRVRDPSGYEPAAGRATTTAARPGRLPRAFWVYAVFVGLTTTGFATFGVLSYHLVTAGLLSAAQVPLLYAAIMVVDAFAAVASGWAYDRWGVAVLAALPVVAAVVPGLAFSGVVAVAVIGTLVWGLALGVQESTLKATVADLVDPSRRATAYGMFGAVVGVGAAAGGALAGGLYQVSVPLLAGVTAAVQAAALVVLLTGSVGGRPRSRTA
ncbi:MAG TPA: MFS transporter [Nocardioidaceae bacterium]|nr:MFS transporter [Nocardioidaceae bacterium]